ncbi:MAG TPA: LacI family DNA-binding transcriptional regulator, partial [Cyclobacteriaceae bacterium]|nr:LacI family DNA-binding transcriptional regulator [Cyclobacteriaceae bacterium]
MERMETLYKGSREEKGRNKMASVAFIMMKTISSFMDKEVTIYDLAKDLGISPTTVSRALNNHPAVKG